MSQKLIEQLADYGRQHRTAQAAIAIDEIVGELSETPHATVVELERNEELASVRRVDGRRFLMADTPVEQGGAARPTRPWIVVSAAAAVVALAVAGVVALQGDEDDSADQVATAGTDATVPAATEPDAPEPTTATSPPTTSPDRATSLVPVVPADAFQEAEDGEVGATSETPLPDFDGVSLVSPGAPPVVLDSVDELPDSARLDFLSEFCDDQGCFRDATFTDENGAELGGAWTAGSPFHVRHGFVVEDGEDLGDGFDLAVYAFPMPFEGRVREPSGSTERYHTDSVVRGETDACGPNYQSQTGIVTCEWFVHDFPDGLPEGRWALWAVWEAPCSAWIELGDTDSCADPDEVMSFFSSGVDSPFDALGRADDSEPSITEVGGWTRVDGSDVIGVVSDGTSFFTSDGFSLRRSDDGVVWEEYAELGESAMQFEALFEDLGTHFEAGGPPATLRDGRLVAVEDLRGDSVIVHIVEPDGAVSTQVVPVEVPAAYEPFHRELDPGVHVLGDGRIVITASYSADAGLVEATGRTRAELGLDLFYPMPRPIVISSADGVTWAQLETPPGRVENITAAPGGLVALVGPIPSGSSDLRLSFSADGAVWQPFPELGVVEDSERFVSAFSTGNRTFVIGQTAGQEGPEEGWIWEIAADGPRLISGGDAAPEPLELFEPYHFGELSAGDAGLAFVSAVDEYMVEMGRQDPLPDGPGIWYSVDDGVTWEFDPFPAELTTGFPEELAIGANRIVLVHHGDGGGPSLWVRDFPG